MTNEPPLEKLAPEGMRATDFLPASRFDADELFRQLRLYVLQVRDPHIRELLLGFLDDPELGPAFRRAPAAKNIHHPFLGGLCEHTLSVLQLGLRICDHYPQLDRDLVTAGCVLHDLGKTRELTYERGFDYSDEGRLVGHLVMTCQWIHERAQRIPGFPRPLEWHLVHLVAAHHGQLEYGSPKVPHTLEAMVVHALDELDSRISSFGLLFEKDRSETAWTDYQRLYERYLFKGPSWNGEPLQHDERRFEGASVYRARADALAAGASPPRAPQRAEVPAAASWPESLPEQSPDARALSLLAPRDGGALPEPVQQAKAVPDLFQRR